MIRESIRDLPRRDRAGPYLLLVLLVIAFIPSVLTEFDSFDILSVIVDTMGRMARPIQLVFSGDVDRPAVSPEAEGPLLHVSAESRPTSKTSIGNDSCGISLPSSSGEDAYVWPHGKSSSPRAPPLSA
ncbi:MAG: hypothetical protein Q8O15_10350 [Rectinemataceae bacterium]|nr:hypothetical protein [Rectinemataceae bacterium]